ncbi:MAG: adenosylmethionine decarboxylase [Chloroflexi bacterium]|nr:adenosylmethionine decarboxylase [Chloroflexota bacterium]
MQSESLKGREGDLNALGKHLLLELKDCNREMLNDVGFLQETLVSVAEQAGATVLEKYFHQFAPQGVSGAVIIAESHLSIHTWPEYGYAAADIFTCGDTVNTEMAAELLIEKLQSRDPAIMEVRRGVRVTEATLVAGGHGRI